MTFRILIVHGWLLVVRLVFLRKVDVRTPEVTVEDLSFLVREFFGCEFLAIDRAAPGRWFAPSPFPALP
jgi:hypothetical protein